MKGMLKWPLVIAAVVIIARVILEQAGTPDGVNNVFSAVVLYVLVFPLYFAFRISGSRTPAPYTTLLKKTAAYAAWTRAMVVVTYWLAYIYQWQAPRFSVSQGGVVGPGVTPLRAFLMVPLIAGVAWVIGAVIIGGGLGSLVIALRRRSATSTT